MAVDPLWEQYKSWTTYGYTRNDPINKIDFTGFGDEPITSDYKGKVEIAPATPGRISIYAPGFNANAYNCHSFSLCGSIGDNTSDPQTAAIRGKLVDISSDGHSIEDALPLWNEEAEDDLEAYTKLSFDAPNEVGDIIGYMSYDAEGKSKIIHSGIVTAVDDKGNASQITSKFGYFALFQHHPRDTQIGLYSYGPQSPTDVEGRPTRVYFRLILRGQETRSTQPASATDPEQVKGNNEKN